MKHLLEENQMFTYYRTVTKDGIDFEVYNDDCGECFYLAWVDPRNHKIKEWGCGSFNNNFYAEIDDIASTYEDIYRNKGL